MEALSLFATVLGLLVIAVPLCLIAVGVHRIITASRDASRSLVKNVKPKASKAVSHEDAARARAQSRLSGRNVSGA